MVSPFIIDMRVGSVLYIGRKFHITFPKFRGGFGPQELSGSIQGGNMPGNSGWGRKSAGVPPDFVFLSIYLCGFNLFVIFS